MTAASTPTPTTSKTLPVPPLRQTLDRYLETVAVLLSPEELEEIDAEMVSVEGKIVSREISESDFAPVTVEETAETSVSTDGAIDFSDQ